MRSIGMKNSGFMIAGGKYDFTAKWWDPGALSAVSWTISPSESGLCKCGEAGHFLIRALLQGVIDLVGKTDIRQFVRLMRIMLPAA